MQPSTVQRILPIVARVLDADPVRQRQKILDEIHACHSLLFLGLGDSVREAFFVRPGCAPIVQFEHDCRSRCRGKYFGFSLPVEVEKAEVFRIEGKRITISSQFSGPLNQWQGCSSVGCFEGLDLGSGWSLPIDPALPVELGFRLRGDGDHPEPVMVGVEYFDLNGRRQREDLEVNAEAITTTRQTVGVLAMNGITLPPNRCHSIQVWCGTDTQITEFHPSIDVPNFHRYAISRPLRGESLVSFEDGLYHPVRPVFDTDRVEMGDPNFWENLIQWRALHFKTKRSTSEERSYASMGQFLVSQAEQTLQIREAETPLVVLQPDQPFREVTRRFQNLTRRHWPRRF